MLPGLEAAFGCRSPHLRSIDCRITHDGLIGKTRIYECATGWVGRTCPRQTNMYSLKPIWLNAAIWIQGLQNLCIGCQRLPKADLPGCFE